MRTTHSTSPDSGASTRDNTMATAHRGIFWRFAARSLMLNRSRTIVSIIGVALSCALITAIFTSVATLYNGLLKAEILTDGTWQVELVNVPDAELVSLRNDPRVVGSFERVSYGDALMPESFQGYWGRYLSVQEWPSKDAVGNLKPLPHLTEGRAPSKPNEIVLNQDLKGMTVDAGNWLYDSLPATGRDDSVPRAAWDGGLEIGSIIELALGERMFLDLESGAEAPCLYTETLYTTETANGDVISEYLANATSPASYTVVGFYGPATSKSYDQWGSSGPGYLGFVSSPDAPARSTSVYVTTNLTNLAEINEFIDDYTGHDTAMQSWGNLSDTPFENWTTGAYTHESLLRYQGITDDRSIWGTLYTLTAILSTVVVVASVSLIYNSFAIAVSERTRQFGLLSSLGASKRQLRRTVYAEALILACIGIPLGLVAGLAGTFVVFNIAGEGIGMLIDQEAFANTGLTTISIHPLVIALCAALALVTALVSAAVPAWRASRTSAVDAIRASRDVRLTRAAPPQSTPSARAATFASPVPSAAHAPRRGAITPPVPRRETDCPVSRRSMRCACASWACRGSSRTATSRGRAPRDVSPWRLWQSPWPHHHLGRHLPLPELPHERRGPGRQRHRNHSQQDVVPRRNHRRRARRHRPRLSLPLGRRGRDGQGLRDLHVAERAF